MAKILVVIAIFFTYPLPYYVAAEIAWKYVKPLICDRFKILTHIMLLNTGVVFTGTSHLTQYLKIQINKANNFHTKIKTELNQSVKKKSWVLH